MDKKWLKRRKCVFEIIEVGTEYDYISRGYDFINAFAIIINLVVSIMLTFNRIEEQYGVWLTVVERLTVGFFSIDFVLRLWTARFLYPELSDRQAIKKYICSFTGIVDLLSFLPYYLPVFFPSALTEGAAQKAL